MGSTAPVPEARSTVSHFESSKPGSAHIGLPVTGSVGESPTENFQGPFRATVLWPSFTRAVSFAGLDAAWAEDQSPQARQRSNKRQKRNRRAKAEPRNQEKPVPRTISSSVQEQITSFSSVDFAHFRTDSDVKDRAPIHGKLHSLRYFGLAALRALRGGGAGREPCDSSGEDPGRRRQTRRWPRHFPRPASRPSGYWCRRWK